MYTTPRCMVYELIYVLTRVCPLQNPPGKKICSLGVSSQCRGDREDKDFPRRVGPGIYCWACGEEGIFLPQKHSNVVAVTGEGGCVIFKDCFAQPNRSPCLPRVSLFSSTPSSCAKLTTHQSFGQSAHKILQWW